MASGGPAPRSRLHALAHRPFVRCPLQSEKYDKLRQVGKGQFGAVFKAKHKETGVIYALKKVIMKGETEGFPLTALREISLMSRLDHPNVLKLHEVVHSQATDHNRQLGDIYLVFDFMDYDLAGLLNKGVEFTVPEVKGMCLDLFKGLNYLALNRVMHRDLKVANLLLNREGVLKIADFGLARYMKEGKAAASYTGVVCTRWYRAPELLLGQRQYDPAIDMWSAGCIVAELITGSPILQGGVRDGDDADHDLDQFLEICKLLGSPTKWEEAMTLRKVAFIMPRRQFNSDLRGRLTQMFSRVKCPEIVDFLTEVLVWDPTKRLTAKKAAIHPCWYTQGERYATPNTSRFGQDTHEYLTRAVPRRDLRMPKTKRQTYEQAGFGLEGPPRDAKTSTARSSTQPAGGGAPAHTHTGKPTGGQHGHRPAAPGAPTHRPQAAPPRPPAQHAHQPSDNGAPPQKRAKPAH